MRKTSCVSNSNKTIRETYTKANMLVWARKNVEEIMRFLGVPNTNWALGGSVAAILYGIDFGRIPRDVDIIVTEGIVDVIKLKVENSTLFRAEPTTSSIDDEWGTKHFAFRAAKGYIIDVIESKEFFNEIYLIFGELNIITIDSQIKYKKQYNRFKDKEDLTLLISKAKQYGYVIDEDYSESTSDSDISDVD